MTAEHRLLVELSEKKREIDRLRRRLRWMESSRDYWRTSARAWQWGNSKKKERAAA